MSHVKQVRGLFVVKLYFNLWMRADAQGQTNCLYICKSGRVYVAARLEFNESWLRSIN